MLCADALQSQREWVFLVNPPFTASTTVRGALCCPMSAKALWRGQWYKDGFRRASHISTLQFMYRLLLLTEQYGIQTIIGIFSQASLLTHDSYASFRQRFEQSFRYQYGFCTNGAEFASAWENGLLCLPRGAAMSNLNWRQSNVLQYTYKTDMSTFNGKRQRTENVLHRRRAAIALDSVRPVNTVPALPVTNAKNVDRSSTGAFEPFARGCARLRGLFLQRCHALQKMLSALVRVFKRGAGWGITADIL